MSEPGISHLVAAYPPHLGGMEAVAQALAQEQSRRGRDVEVLTTTMGAESAPLREREGAVTVRRHPARVVAHTPLSPSLGRSVLAVPADRILHVHVAQAAVLELARLRRLRTGAPYVAHLHLDIEASGPAGRLLPAYKRWSLGPALRAATRVIVLNEAMGDLVRTRYRVPADRVVVVPNGVADDYVRLGAARSTTPLDGPLRLLYAGRLAKQKNLPRLLHALARVSAPVHTRIVGDGADRRALEQLSAELGLAGVEFLGVQRGAEYRAQLEWAQAWVLPSDAEGMPIALLEAMAAGLPVVATDVTGTRELLGSDGLLVSPEPGALATGIDRLAADAALRDRLGQQAHRSARSRSWTDIADRLDHLYADVLVRPQEAIR